MSVMWPSSPAMSDVCSCLQSGQQCQKILPSLRENYYFTLSAFVCNRASFSLLYYLHARNNTRKKDILDFLN